MRCGVWACTQSDVGMIFRSKPERKGWESFKVQNVCKNAFQGATLLSARKTLISYHVGDRQEWQKNEGLPANEF